MIYLLRYADYHQSELEDPLAVQTKHFQHMEMARMARRFDGPGLHTGEIGCKVHFANLMRFRESRRFVIDPYNGAPGGGPTDIPKLPYPIALFRCLVGPDSGIVPDKFFDVTFSISVIEHVGQAEAGFDCQPTDTPPVAQEALRTGFCSELYRMTKPGGVTLHTVDHAARNLSFVANFEGAGFERLDSRAPPPTSDDCLNDPGAVRQKVTWRNRERAMPAEQQCLHSCLMLGFRRPL